MPETYLPDGYDAEFVSSTKGGSAAAAFWWFDTAPNGPAPGPRGAASWWWRRPLPPDLIAAVYAMLMKSPVLQVLEGRIYNDTVTSGARLPYLEFEMNQEEVPGEVREHVPTSIDFDLFANSYDEAKRLGDIMADWIDPEKSGRSRMVYTGGSEIACWRESSTIRVLDKRKNGLRIYDYTVRFEVHCDEGGGE